MASQLTRSVCLGGMAAVAGMILLLLHFCSGTAKAVQPTNTIKLAGNWVNLNPDGVVAQVDISEIGGMFEVHPYGFCSPTPCDWGAVPALRFSDSVLSSSASGFQATVVSTGETDYMQGHLVTLQSGQSALEITTQREFPSGDSRENHEVTEDFQVSLTGVAPGSTFPVNGGLIGTWVNTKSDGGVAQVVISESGGSLQVHPYGTCSPSYCDWGERSALQFSGSATSSAGVGFQVTINQNSETEYMQGHLVAGTTGQNLLEITTQTTFNGRGDLRNDYELVEDFQLSTTGQSGFSLAPATANLAVPAGGQATETITVTPLNGAWDTAVELTCAVAGAAPMPNCSVSPASVTPGGSSITSTLTVTAAKSTAMRMPPEEEKYGKTIYAAWLLLPAMVLGLAAVPKNERRRRGMLVGLLVLAAVMPVACGGGGSSSTSNMGQGTTSHTISVTGASGTMQQTIQITILTQ